MIIDTTFKTALPSYIFRYEIHMMTMRYIKYNIFDNTIHPKRNGTERIRPEWNGTERIETERNGTERTGTEWNGPG